MDRYYQTYDITIRDSIAATLILWNSSNDYIGEKFDFLFAQFLLIDIFGGEALADGNLDANKMQFVKELFRIRVKNDEDRNTKLAGIIEQVRHQFKVKHST